MKKDMDLQSNTNIKNKVESAKDILKIVCNKVSKDMPQYIMFVPLLKPIAVEEDILLETDGKNIFFNADNVIMMYKARQLQILEHHYMHILTHGVLGHFSIRKKDFNSEFYHGKDDIRIDLVLDFIVNKYLLMIYQNKLVDDGIESPFFRYIYTLTRKERELYDKMLTMNIGELYYLCRERSKELEILKKVVHVYDDHNNWNRNKEFKILADISELADASESMTSDEEWEQMRELAGINGEKGLLESIKKRMEMYGVNSSNLRAYFSSAAGKSLSYRELLEEFLIEKEVLFNREDSIDKIMYSYGFSLYDNVALIEPEEYTVEKTLPTIAIAIDTSGSCNGEIMEKFLNETSALLHEVCKYDQIESIYIFQCDSEIKYEEKLSDLEDISKILNKKNFEIHGLGGTSFVPVIDRLNEIGIEAKIGALIYLTDGYGTFPKNVPTYPIVFVTPEYSNEKIPSYIRRIRI